MRPLSDLASFIRLKVCIFISAVGINGYLLFNKLDISVLAVILASFFISAGSYSLNSMRDTKEDIECKRKVSAYAYSRSGYVVVLSCFALGIMFSLFLSESAILFSLLGLVTSAIYSQFKLKRFFLVKNLYTGISLSMIFLMGAGKIDSIVAVYYLLTVLFTITLSLISDLRDYHGDKSSGFRTLPVALGYNLSKIIAIFLMALFLLFVAFNLWMVAVAPFAISIVYLIVRDKIVPAHTTGLYSFVFLACWLVMGV